MIAVIHPHGQDWFCLVVLLLSAFILGLVAGQR